MTSSSFMWPSALRPWSMLARRSPIGEHGRPRCAGGAAREHQHGTVIVVHVDAVDRLDHQEMIVPDVPDVPELIILIARPGDPVAGRHVRRAHRTPRSGSYRQSRISEIVPATRMASSSSPRVSVVAGLIELHATGRARRGLLVSPAGW